MFRESYTLELIISAVLTLLVILLVVRLYLKIINKPSGLRKPDWMSESEFEHKFGKKK